MAKTKLYKLHKIKIHQNRWLIWTVAYLLCVGIALIGYLKFSNLTIDSENSAENVFLPALSYSSPSLGFALRYPNSWSIEADSTNSISFLPTDSVDSGVNVLVTTPQSEVSIRKTLKIFAETRTTVDGLSAAKITNQIGQDHFETVVMALHDHKLFVFRGSDNFVEKLLLTFHFLETK